MFGSYFCSVFNLDPNLIYSNVWKQIYPAWWSYLWRPWRVRDVGVLNDSALHIVHPTQIQEVVCVMTYFYAPCLMKLAKFFLNKSLTNLTHMTELFLLGEKKKRKLFEEALQFYLKSGQGDSFQFDFFFLFLSKIFWQLVLLPVGNSYLFFIFCTHVTYTTNS